MIAAMPPTQIGSAPEFTRIVKVSLPSYCVPSQCSPEGAVQICDVSVGLCWSTTSGPTKENSTIPRTSTVPANPAGERVRPVQICPNVLSRNVRRGFAAGASTARMSAAVMLTPPGSRT
jgi:hypothetical protein